MTITLSPKLEARLKEQAARQGEEPETLAEALLSAALDWESEDRADAIAGIRRGLEASAAGRVRPAADVFADIRALASQARVAGLHPGAIQTAADFDAPLPEEFWSDAT